VPAGVAETRLVEVLQLDAVFATAPTTALLTRSSATSTREIDHTKHYSHGYHTPQKSATFLHRCAFLSAVAMSRSPFRRPAPPRVQGRYPWRLTQPPTFGELARQNLDDIPLTSGGGQLASPR
jgi:hypothetical protein